MMKVAECMEDDSMHKKVRTLQVLQLTMRVSIGSTTQITSGPKRGQKRIWDKNPPKDKKTLEEKKPQNVTKVHYFNCKELGHLWRIVKR
jgi:hypothetical protein